MPVDAVVGSVADRRRCQAIRDRVFAGPLTQSHLHVVDQYVSVCQPGPMLVQLAMDMDEVDLAQIACELCGTYGLTPWAEDSFQSDLTALTSRAELVGYAKSARAVGVRGAGKAVRALDLATDGSASPRETDLAVFFLLSRRLGGAGLGGFAVNASLEVPQRHREALDGQSEVKPDFLWTDAKLVVEYDSDAYHLTPKKKESDEARRRVLEAMGYTVMVVTNELVKDGAKLDAFVDDLTCRLGLRRRPLTKWQQDSRDKLRERLFGAQN